MKLGVHVDRRVDQNNEDPNHSGIPQPCRRCQLKTATISTPGTQHTFREMFRTIFPPKQVNTWPALIDEPRRGKNSRNTGESDHHSFRKRSSVVVDFTNFTCAAPQFSSSAARNHNGDHQKPPSTHRLASLGSEAHPCGKQRMPHPEPG